MRTEGEMHRDGEIVRENKDASQRDRWDKGEMEAGRGWKEAWVLGHKHWTLAGSAFSAKCHVDLASVLGQPCRHTNSSFSPSNTEG